MDFSLGEKGFNKVEALIMATIIIAFIVAGVIWLFGVAAQTRDIKRKSDVKIIAGSVESHYNTKNSEFCDNGLIGSYCHPRFNWFQGGVPHDPLWGDYINLPTDGDKQYIICAKLERGGGNSASTDGTLATGNNANYYCQRNQQ